jgi:hypothetical protein
MESSNFIIRNNGGTEDYAKFFGNGACNLYSNNSLKLATTSTGINVTGSVTCETENPILKIKDTSTGGSVLVKVDASSGGTDHIESDVNNLTIGTTAASKILRLKTGGIERLRITSDGSVGIGTSSPSQKLHVAGGQARFDDHISIQPTKKLYLDGGNDTYIDEVAANTIAFNSGGGERMRITTTGIDVTGTVTCDGLTSEVSAGASLILKTSNASLPANFAEWHDTRGRTGYIGFDSNGNDNFTLMNEMAGFTAIGTNNAERMRITSSGNVGIGTSSPSQKLSVSDGAHITEANATAADNSGDYTLAVGNNSGNKSAHFKGDIKVDGIVESDGVTVATGEVIGNKYHSVSENIYWNSKLISAAGHGSAPDKWFTQGVVTITSEHPFNKGFSTQYTNTQGANHVTDINLATPSNPHWKGVYTTFSGAVNYGGNQNSSIGGGWEHGEGAIMKMVYNGTGASNSTQAVRANIFKNFFSEGRLALRQSFFYYIESGEFSSGWFAGYNGNVGGTSENFDSTTARHKFTNLQEWTYINHAASSYTGATYQNSSQSYLNGFGFTPGVASIVWIAIPGLTTSMKSNGHSINITSATQVIGQG